MTISGIPEEELEISHEGTIESFSSLSFSCYDTFRYSHD